MPVNYIQSGLHLEANEYTVENAQLLLSVNSAPQLTFFFGPHHPPLAAQMAVMAASRTPLTWSGIEFFPLGFDETISPGHQSEASLAFTGLVIPKSLLDWFNQCPPSDILYQKEEFGQQELGRTFLERLCHGKIRLREEEKQALDHLFIPFATLWRKKEEDNFTFLQKVLTWLHSKDAKIIGWAVVVDQQPLRLVSMYETCAPKQLDPQYWAPQGRFPANRHAGTSWFQHHFQLKSTLRTTDLCEFLLMLTEANVLKQIPCGISSQVLSQLIVMPGPVIFLGQTYFCSSIRYDFIEPLADGYVQATIDLTCPPGEVIPFPFAPHTFECRFKKWQEQEKKEHVLLDTGKVSNSNGDPQCDLPLYARLLSPTAGRKDFQGIYITYKEGDPVLCLLEPGKEPVVLGRFQVYNELFEMADIVFNAPKVVVSTSSHQTSLEDANGLKFKGAHVEIVAETTQIADNVTVTGLSTKIKEDVQMQGSLKVEKKLDVGQ